MNSKTSTAIEPRQYTTRATCRVCGSKELKPLFSLGNQYVNDFPDAATVQAGYANCPRCPIELQLCLGCTLVQQAHTAPQELLYSRKYWYKSGTTQTMRDILAHIAERATKEARLEPDDVVLDIGSNDATLLKCFDPQYERIGVEPATNMREYYDDSLSVIQDFWGADGVAEDFLTCYGTAKVVTALGMFYDLEDPVAFVRGVAKVLAEDGVFIAQLMCLRQTVQKADVGNYCHEHLEFYSLQSLQYLYRLAGLEIYHIEANDVNGGSYLIYAQKPSRFGRLVTRSVSYYFDLEYSERLTDPATLNAHYQSMLANAQRVVAYIAEATAKGKRTFVYGASTKGNVILQFFGLNHRVILGAADRDPAKWGRYTVGTGIPIMSEEAVRQLDPDYMLVLPYAFLDEFVRREANQKWRQRGGKFIVPVPTLRIV